MLFVKKILKEANPKSTFKSIDVSDLFRKYLLKGPNLNNKYYSYYVTVRLLADLVPEIPDKVIYLDADTIFVGDVKELWNIDVDNVEMAGRPPEKERFLLPKSGTIESRQMKRNL